MNYETILTETRGKVALITLNRPKRQRSCRSSCTDSA